MLYLKNFISEHFSKYPVKNEKKQSLKSKKTLLKEDIDCCYKTVLNSTYKCYLWKNYGTKNQRLIAMCSNYNTAVRWTNNYKSNITLVTKPNINKPYIIQIKVYGKNLRAIVNNYDNALKLGKIYGYNKVRIISF